MADKVDFTYSTIIPKIYVQNKHTMLNLTTTYQIASF